MIKQACPRLELKIPSTPDALRVEETGDVKQCQATLCSRDHCGCPMTALSPRVSAMGGSIPWGDINIRPATIRVL